MWISPATEGEGVVRRSVRKRGCTRARARARQFAWHCARDTVCRAHCCERRWNNEREGRKRRDERGGRLRWKKRETRRGGRSARGTEAEGWRTGQGVRSNYVRERLYRVPNLITAISRRLCVPNISNYGGVPRMTNRRALRRKGVLSPGFWTLLAIHDNAL